MNARRTGPGSNLPSLRLHLFGASRLSANGVDTGLALKRGFALLAYLAHECDLSVLPAHWECSPEISSERKKIGRASCRERV